MRTSHSFLARQNGMQIVPRTMRKAKR
jgi:hypothetical protein